MYPAVMAIPGGVSRTQASRTVIPASSVAAASAVSADISPAKTGCRHLMSLWVRQAAVALRNACRSPPHRAAARTRRDRNLIRGTELTGQLTELRVISRHAEKVRIKIAHVLPELAGGIAIGIHRDKDELDVFGAGRALGDVFTRAGQCRQGRRTDVRAMSVAEK